MIARYGSYSHDANSVRVAMSQSLVLNESGLPDYVTRTVEISGDLIANTEAEMTAKGIALINAYNQHGRDFALTDDSGATTIYTLDQGSSINGVQVTDWSLDEGVVYSAILPFSITLQADYDIPGSTNDLLRFTETIITIGTGGQKVAMQQGLVGPVPQVLALATAVTVLQIGSAVGRDGYPIPPSPLLSAWEDEERRNIQRTGGQDAGGGVFRNFGVNWTYQFLIPESPGIVLPNVR